MCLPECCATAARRAGQGRIRSWRRHCTRTHRTHRNRSQLHSARWATELATNQRPQTQHTAAKVLHMHLPLLQQTCGSGATHSARKLPALPLCAMNCHTHAANLPRIKVQAMQDMPLAWTDGATAAVASRPTTTRVRTDIMIARSRGSRSGQRYAQRVRHMQPKQDRHEKNVSIFVRPAPHSAACTVICRLGEGRMVMVSLRFGSGAPGIMRRENRRTRMASDACISITANRWPMQERSPNRNGMNVNGFGRARVCMASSTYHRSGLPHHHSSRPG